MRMEWRHTAAMHLKMRAFYSRECACVYPLLRLGYCIRYNRVAARAQWMYVCMQTDCWLSARSLALALSLSPSIPLHTQDTWKAFDLSPVHGSPHLRMQIQFYFSQNMNY